MLQLRPKWGGPSKVSDPVWGDQNETFARVRAGPETDQGGVPGREAARVRARPGDRAEVGSAARAFLPLDVGTPAGGLGAVDSMVRAGPGGGRTSPGGGGLGPGGVRSWLQADGPGGEQGGYRDVPAAGGGARLGSAAGPQPDCADVGPAPRTHWPSSLRARPLPIKRRPGPARQTQASPSIGSGRGSSHRLSSPPLTGKPVRPRPSGLGRVLPAAGQETSPAHSRARPGCAGCSAQKPWVPQARPAAARGAEKWVLRASKCARPLVGSRSHPALTTSWPG